jgi:putative phage-type endonuclease
MLTKQQLENRTNYIGGSDAPIILGLSPYRNQVDLWHEKTGHIEPKDISNNPYVKAGNFLEPSVKRWFEHETGLKITNENEFYEHPDHNFIGGHIDGFIREENAVFEAKTSSSDKGWGANGSNEIPDSYLIQIAHYMSITGASKAYIAVLIRGVDFRYYIIKRNQRLEDMIIEREKEFWSLVINNYAPTPKKASEIISLNGFKSVEESVVADNEIQNYLEKLEQVNFQMLVLSRQKEEMSDKIKLFMGEKDTLIESNGKIAATWKETKASTRFDADTFKKEKPDDYCNYIKTTSGSRRFCVVKKNEELRND